ncbi:MAG TPA: hypothetical protein VNQ79_03255 [Blastocatellia bacterium]|nr:hypothetical protein [Blastocatellia bacterium]
MEYRILMYSQTLLSFLIGLICIIVLPEFSLYNNQFLLLKSPYLINHLRFLGIPWIGLSILGIILARVPQSEVRDNAVIAFALFWLLAGFAAEITIADAPAGVFISQICFAYAAGYYYVYFICFQKWDQYLRQYSAYSSDKGSKKKGSTHMTVLQSFNIKTRIDAMLRREVRIFIWLNLIFLVSGMAAINGYLENSYVGRLAAPVSFIFLFESIKYFKKTGYCKLRH